MSANKRIYVNKVCQTIIDQINGNADLNFVKTVNKGDLSILPPPEKFADFMPIILVKPVDLYSVTTRNGRPVTGNEYVFTISYLEYFDIRVEAIDNEQVIGHAEVLGDTLVDNLTGEFNGPFVLSESTSKVRTAILESEIFNMDFNPSEVQVFKNLKLPVGLVNITFGVYVGSLLMR